MTRKVAGNHLNLLLRLPQRMRKMTLHIDFLVLHMLGEYTQSVSCMYVMLKLLRIMMEVVQKIIRDSGCVRVFGVCQTHAGGCQMLAQHPKQNLWTVARTQLARCYNDNVKYTLHAIFVFLHVQILLQYIFIHFLSVLYTCIISHSSSPVKYVKILFDVTFCINSFLSYWQILIYIVHICLLYIWRNLAWQKLKLWSLHVLPCEVQDFSVVTLLTMMSIVMYLLLQT